MVRTTLQIVAIALSASSIVAISCGAPKLGSTLAVTGGLLGATLSIARTIREDQDRRALASTLSRLEAFHG